MTKVDVGGISDVSDTQDKVKFETLQASDFSLLNQPTIVIISNRQGVELGKNLITSGSQATSIVVIVDDISDNEILISPTASSQVGIVKFRETRLLSSKEINRRAIEALQKAEERRKRLVEIEEDDEIDL